MGTHPIFESDFDCLTDGKTKMNRIINRNPILRVYRQNSKISKNKFEPEMTKTAARKYLNLNSDYSRQDVKSAYLAKAKIVHPDVKGTGNAKEFRKLQKAAAIVASRRRPSTANKTLRRRLRQILRQIRQITRRHSLRSRLTAKTCH